MRLLPLVLALSIVAPVSAQERDPDLRQALVDLARTMGETHALRQACEGREDRRWRTRMTDLIDQEQPDEALAKRLMDSFNAGATAGRVAHPDCSDATREAQLQAAERGYELAARLAVARRRVPGWLPSLPEPGAEEVTAEVTPG